MYAQAERIVAVSTLFLVLSWIFLSLRCFVRIRIVRKFGIDDALIVLAVVLFTVLCGFVFHGVQSEGFGSHQSHGSTMKWVFFLYVFSTTVTKLSVGFLLLRICTIEQSIYRWIIWINLLICCLSFISAVPLIFLQCSVHQLHQAHSSCLKPSLGATGLPFSVVDIVSEWVFAVLPIVLLWNVKIPLKVKVSLMAILAMGILASTACVVYTVLLARAINSQNIYQMSGTLVWAQTKTGLGIVASSAATLRPLLKELKNGTVVTRHFKRVSSSTVGGSHGSGGMIETLETLKTIHPPYEPSEELQTSPGAMEMGEAGIGVPDKRPKVEELSQESIVEAP